jgi:hypothetical protein
MWAGHLLGTTHDTYAIFGTQASMNSGQALTMLQTLVNNDLIVDSGLIA